MNPTPTSSRRRSWRVALFGLVGLLVLGTGAVILVNARPSHRGVPTPDATVLAQQPAPPAVSQPAVGQPKKAAAVPPSRPASAKAVRYADCAAVQAAGVPTLLRGRPGYRAALDQDGDGKACEPNGDDAIPPGRNDPIFRTCAEVIEAGYGPYRRGLDPEYDWYRDNDSDGDVCES
ncbi:MAG: excalibur calcium-binding domain-containing protein [Actinoplanes sp.]